MVKEGKYYLYDQIRCRKKSSTYSEKLMKMKGSNAFASSILIVEVGLFSTTYLVFIIERGSHICASAQRLQRINME